MLFVDFYETHKHKIDSLIESALEEDIGSGDLTTEAIIAPEKAGEAILLAKADLILAGSFIFQKVFEKIDHQIEIHFEYADGDWVEKFSQMARISGSINSILKAERTALNFLQHMSGIASLTYAFKQEIENTKTQILDTRKTVPGMRLLDKWSVFCGGGVNHRYGLYDQVLIKDNHITGAGGIMEAVNQVLDKVKDKIVVVEVKNLEELKECLELPVTRILLDNMKPELMQEAVRLTNGKFPLEASGNINLKNVKKIAETGVDFVSVGMLTHSVKAADISLLIK